MGPINKPLERPEESGKKPEKLSPAQILERMQSAQSRLESEEEKRVDSLLEREVECNKTIDNLQARLEEAKKALGIARESVAGKKNVSEEYTAGFEELEETAKQTEDSLRVLRAELDEIRKDPGVIERKKQEAEKKKKQAKEVEIKKLSDEVREEEKKVGELVMKMIAFLSEDKGWSVDLDKLHLFGYSKVGGLFNNDVDELQKDISPLDEEMKEALSKLEVVEQSYWKLGVKKLRERIGVLGEKISELVNRQNELKIRVGEKRKEFIKIEAVLRGQISVYHTRLQQLEQKTGKKPEGTKIKLSDDFLKDFYRTRGGYDAPIAGFGIYKPLLKQFGFDADRSVAK
ncbi:MAG: Myosin II heavy chain [Candidatus Magasanikbacteria bacterium GW2011_GWA2_41_55]|uniref:Myosin II heavy chain n=2 Tax=Candidatus Magasanikiibacteriota TaxID=1752731 RepID=A0A0G0WL75_9BACT|nr:MAG: Myosin II heavy chain [Candidatus Magasanikbacteria bacterium GW2011_GWA2_41_55]